MGSSFLLLFTTVLSTALLVSAIGAIPTTRVVVQDVKHGFATVHLEALNTATASFKEASVPRSPWLQTTTIASFIIAAAMMPVLSIFAQKPTANGDSHDDELECVNQLVGTEAMKHAMAELDQRYKVNRCSIYGCSQLTQHPCQCCTAHSASMPKPFQPLKPRRVSIPAAETIPSLSQSEVVEVRQVVEVRKKRSSKRVSFGGIRIHELCFVPTMACTHGVVIDGEWCKAGERVCSVDHHERFRATHCKPCKDEYLFEGRRSRKGPIQGCCVCNPPAIDESDLDCVDDECE